MRDGDGLAAGHPASHPTSGATTPQHPARATQSRSCGCKLCKCVRTSERSVARVREQRLPHPPSLSSDTDVEAGSILVRLLEALDETALRPARRARSSAVGTCCLCPRTPCIVLPGVRQASR